MLKDIKNAARSLFKSPGFTFAAALTLALGIGANTAIFSVINDVLLRDLPYAEPERLVMLWEHNTRRDRPMNVVSPANFQDWRDSSKSFEAMGAFFDRSFTLTGSGDPVEVRATAVTANMFEMLGAQAQLGRVFSAEDEKPESALSVVLAHQYWRDRFGSDPGVVGRTLTLSGNPANVIGVLPEGFGFYIKEASFNRTPPSVWVQARFDAASRVRRGRLWSCSHEAPFDFVAAHCAFRRLYFLVAGAAAAPPPRSPGAKKTCCRAGHCAATSPSASCSPSSAPSACAQC